MKKWLTAMLLLAVFCGCSNDQNKDASYTEEKTLEEVLAENQYIIVDVRTKEEYDSGHVVDAIHIPYDEIDQDTQLDKSKTIIVYCKSGRRSKIAYDTLTSLGYEVFDLGAYDTISLEKESSN